jgi:hypothetical protein
MRITTIVNNSNGTDNSEAIRNFHFLKKENNFRKIENRKTVSAEIISKSLQRPQQSSQSNKNLPTDLQTG